MRQSTLLGEPCKPHTHTLSPSLTRCRLPPPAAPAVLLRVLPAIIYWAPFYYMAHFRYGSAYAATYVFTLITFSCAMGALSMAVTVGCSTAGEASFLMNFILLFSLVFTGGCPPACLRCILRGVSAGWGSPRWDWMDGRMDGNWDQRWW